jgi:hypothetical protein
MSSAALAFAESQTWSRRAEKMNELYAETMNRQQADVVPARQWA